MNFEVEDAPDTGEGGPDAEIAGLIEIYPMDGAIVNGVVPSLSGANDGSCANPTCPSSTAGQTGGGYAFNASELIALPEAVAARIGDQPYTVALWLAPVPSASDLALFAKPFSAAASSNVASLAIPAGTRHLTFETTPDGSAFGYLDTPAALDIADGAWHHAAISWDGTSKRIYVDGALVGVLAATVVNADQPLVIGVDLDGAAAVHHYTGALDDLRIYARALRDTEIAALAGSSSR